MKHIYICGKIIGDPNYQEKFQMEKDRLESFGYIAVNPTAFVPASDPWPKAMKTAIRAMLLCDGISLLPDWKESKGAKIEVALAKKLGMEIRESHQWLF